MALDIRRLKTGWKVGMVVFGLTIAVCVVPRKQNVLRRQLAVAMADNNTSEILALLAKNAPVDSVDSYGTDLLSQACLVGNLHVAKVLLEREFSLESENHIGHTALMLAANSGNYELVELLLDKGAEPNTTTPDGKSALNFAAKKGDIEIGQLLISRNAVINSENQSRTPLHSAAFWGHLKFVQLLVTNGADLAVRNHLGKTAQDLAAESGHSNIVEWINTVNQ